MLLVLYIDTPMGITAVASSPSGNEKEKSGNSDPFFYHYRVLISSESLVFL